MKINNNNNNIESQTSQTVGNIIGSGIKKII
jgi:hypothetical protein